MTDDFPGLEETIWKILSEVDEPLCALHSVREALNQARKKDRMALVKALRAVYHSETEDEAKEALKRVRERWVMVYPCIAARWKTRAYILPAFLRHPRLIRQCLCTTNQPERVAREVKVEPRWWALPGRKRS